LDQNIIIKETLPALESVVKAGKAKFIGITGYDLNCMQQIIEKSEIPIDCILSYARCNFHDMSLNDFEPYFKVIKF